VPGNVDDVQIAVQVLSGIRGRRLDLIGVGVGQVIMDLGGHRCLALEGRISVDGAMAEHPQDLEGLALLLPLLSQVVTDVHVAASGDLTVGFEQGAAMHCEAGEQYESWNYTDPGGGLVVCLPGGGLAVWGSTR
jgi:hypothetical protein